MQCCLSGARSSSRTDGNLSLFATSAYREMRVLRELSEWCGQYFLLDPEPEVKVRQQDPLGPYFSIPGSVSLIG